MAGKIVADTLEHSTAGSVTTDYVVNGSAKSWVNYNGTGTIAARDSFNFSGLTDHGTGQYTVTLSNSMDNVNYAVSFGGGQHSDSRHFHAQSVTVTESGGGTAPTTSAVKMNNYMNGNTANNADVADHPYVCLTIHGDLA